MESSDFIKKNAILWIVLLISLVVVGLYMGFNLQNNSSSSDEIKVVQEWELPEELEEISGIAAISDNQIACVQDELGSIFIFDISAEKITQKIPFGKAGDYEGITVVENTAYILRSDGSLFEVKNFKDHSAKVEIHDTPFSEGYDLEGLTYDKNKNRLLLSIKESDEDQEEYRGIYAFDLRTKSFQKEPVFKLKYPFETDGDLKFRPSEIELSKGGIYLVDSKKPAIVRYEKEIPKKVYYLNEDQFPQPEGLTIGRNGKIFLSSEGKPGKIFQIEWK